MGWRSNEQGRTATTTSSTATLFAAASGYRHSLQKGLMVVGAATGNTVVDIIETDTTASDVGTLWSMSASQLGYYDFDFGARGYKASATGTRIAVSQTGSESTVFVLAIGSTQ